MDNMKIGGSLNIIKKITAPKTTNNAPKNNSTNPFGLAFKGKHQTTDLFVKTDSASATGWKDTVLKKGKMVASAAVASLTQIKNTFVQKFEPVIKMVKETHAKISEIGEKISSFKASDLKISNLIKHDEYPLLSKQAKKLVKMPVSDLKQMWKTAEAAHIAAKA